MLFKNASTGDHLRRMIVAETLFANVVAQPFVSAGGQFRESRERDVFRQRNNQEAGQFEVLTVWRFTI